MKLAVGIDTIAHLRERQLQRLAAQRTANGGEPRLRILTRNRPRRGDEIVDGDGSLYWVIKGQIQVRQRIIGIEMVENGEGSRRCAIYLEPELVRVRPRRSRPFQGWRYLAADRAPPDAASRGSDEADEAPPEMAAELRELGLL